MPTNQAEMLWQDALIYTTNHKQAEVALREQATQLREVQRLACIGSWMHDFATGRLTCSDQMCEIFGISPETVYTFENFLATVHPDDQKFVRERLMTYFDSGEPAYQIEYRFLPPGQPMRHLLTLGNVTRDAAGQPVRMFGLTQDITERKRAQDALTLFRSLIDHTNDAIEVIDLETGRFLDVNEQACLSHGYTREEYLALSVTAIDPRVTATTWANTLAKLRSSGSHVFESQHRRKDGSIFPVEVNANYIRLDRDYLLAVVRDITERKRAEQALVESHNLLNAVVEGTTDAVYVKDIEGRYLMINSAGARALDKQVEEVIGKDDRELFAPDTARAIMQSDHLLMTTGESQIFERVTTTASVTRIYLSTKSVYRDAHGTVIGLIGISRDVTEQKQMEEQFRQAQKMEAVGRLAGGIAHDFNNILTVINGYSGLILRRLHTDETSRRQLSEIQKAGERAANLTHQLLAFSRKQVLQPQVVSLNHLLGELIKLLRRLIGEDIELALVPGADLGLAKIDPGQFEQAIINFVVNARDAMPQGGRLTLATYNSTLDAAYAARFPEVRAGQYVCVTVSDTGLGMDEMTQVRIFEPFFTTKEPGKGTGLGLAMVYGFVKQSGGHIEVISKSDCGTTFKVYLPCTEETSPAAKSPTNVLNAPKGTETILLAEDEDAVRNLVRLVLQSSGYTVLEARDGQEAIRLAEKHPGPIHLLVTDLVMPRMSGQQLADHMAQARPDVRILFISGYTDKAAEQHGLVEAGVAFVQKPFDPVTLAAKVRALLDMNADRNE